MRFTEINSEDNNDEQEERQHNCDYCENAFSGIHLASYHVT